MTWWVFRCRHCGGWQVKETREGNITEKTFKCFRCEKSTTIKLKRSKVSGLNLRHYGPFNNSREASAVCNEVKIHEGTLGGKLFQAELNEFQTYSVR